jgi:transposase
MRQHCLRDDQWDRIQDTVPGRAGSVGVTAADNRRFVDAVLYRYRTGIPWRDLPETFGDWNNTRRRFSRWAARGVWEELLALLAVDADNEYAVIENFFCWVKRFRAIATRYDKTARNFRAAFQMIAVLCWLN